MLALAVLLSLAAPSLTAARAAANLDVSTVTHEAYGCGVICQFSKSQPGDLLKFEAVDPDGLDVITGMSAYRFQYTSRDLNGSPIPATGFIGIPYTSFRKDRKYPVIAYAHGTIGVFAGCPPSTTPTLYDYTGWSILIEKGYAIVSPDYAGLGNNYTLHKYLNFPAHANDLYYSLIAARKAFPGVFTDVWMSVGHSQGGGAVWKLSESNMLQAGAAAESIKILAQASNYASYDILYESIWLPFNRTKIANITQACNYAAMSLAYGLQPSGLFTPAIQNNADIQKWQDLVAPANGAKAREPMMIIQGLNDTAVLHQTTFASFMVTCRYGNEAHLRLYPGMDHSDVLTASSPEWLAFINGRFAGRKSTGNYSIITHRPFNAAHVVTDPEAKEIASI
ncbi:hypothetical protein BDV23DRAFT_194421 [Aspergillus alliaceus]|uniref:Alpha/Beta hydrolase protein n=1 Tax=Petromyces alliaceus TaxID=209559 RepID=A0A5N7C732_PETAA|nr:hypothetical protein BDV23DRAFT_194421 [Aspergillus alliaceus]